MNIGFHEPSQALKIEVLTAERNAMRIRAELAEQRLTVYNVNGFADADALAASFITLTAERNALKEGYLEACQLVAEMHAAATGRPGGGPTFGVVEDVAAVRVERDALKANYAALDADKLAMDALCEDQRKQIDALKAQLAAPVTEAEIRARNDGCVQLDKGVTLILKEELDALKADTERLDWAESNPVVAIRTITSRWHECGSGFREKFFAFRSAIDAARSAV